MPSISQSHQRLSSALILRCSDISRMALRKFTVFNIVLITENRKHPSSPECLVSVQKVMEGSELELAKVTRLVGVGVSHWRDLPGFC